MSDYQNYKSNSFIESFDNENINSNSSLSTNKQNLLSENSEKPLIFTRRNALSLLALASSSVLLSGCAVGEAAYSFLQPVKGQRVSHASSPVVQNILYGSDKGKSVVNTARSQLGVRYTLGGTSPSTGFDCSGLIWWAYKEHGITIPRVTKDQAYSGKPAPTSNLQAGDILVFASSAAPNNLHTALYIGNKKFIHSPNSRSKVRENSLNESYWRDTLALARRII